MWTANTETASASLSTPFIEGIANGTLDPTTYGSFCVNDLYYCFNGADDYQDAAARATDPNLSGYLTAKFQSYTTYDQVLSTTWHINGGASLVPTPVCKELLRLRNMDRNTDQLDLRIDRDAPL